MQLNRTLLVILLTLPITSCFTDEVTPETSATPNNDAGGAGSSTNKDGGAPIDRGCPLEVPVVGEACQTTSMLCQYKRGGPCPPDPDQLRVCTNGSWAALAPAIACGTRAMGRSAIDDAGSD